MEPRSRTRVTHPTPRREVGVERFTANSPALNPRAWSTGGVPRGGSRGTQVERAKRFFTGTTNLRLNSASDWSIEPTSSRQKNVSTKPAVGDVGCQTGSTFVSAVDLARRFKSHDDRGSRRKKGSGVGAERTRRDTTRGAGSPSRALRPRREVVGDARPFDAGLRDRPRATHRPPRDPPPPARLRFRPV